MCGIGGFIGFKNDELIKEMSANLKHRGPDGEGFYIDEHVSLLNRRLAIIDRKGGDQPIYNEDKSVVVVYNGEIYNYRKLREELEKKGHTFSTHSDTEVIVHGYEQWGDEAFDRYNGMFGVALYDKKKKRLILARDHFGIKPLYYCFLNDSVEGISQDKNLLFSSEIKPLLQSGLVEAKPNDRIIYRYLKYRIHDDGEETFFQGIYRLLPGEMMVIEDGKMEKKHYSSLEKDLKNSFHLKDESFAQGTVAQFKEHFVEAVKKRLISEVPVGSCLSGGLDSSAVVATVNTLLSEKISEAQSVGKIQNTFSAVFPGYSNDETKYVNSLVQSLRSKVQGHIIQPSRETFFKELEVFVKTQEEPTISTGPYAQYKVMEEVYKYVTVVLDGQGSDEMMAGYLPYYFVYLQQLYKEKKYVKLTGELFGSLDVLLKYLLMKIGGEQSVDVNIILNKEFNENHSKEQFTVEKTNLKKRLFEDIFKNSLQSLLRYEDRNSMKFSVEGRVPFLDFNLVRYVFSLPDEAIIKNGWNKHVLRESMEQILPDLIRKRRNKIGFTTPEYEWFMNSKEELYKIFLSESFASRPYWNHEVVLKKLREFFEKKNTDTLLFWRLMNVELWMRIFIDSGQTSNVKRQTSEPSHQDEIIIQGKRYERYLIKTSVFQKGDDVVKKISDHALHYINIMKWDGDKKFFIVVSEKIVAISQGRSYFIWDIQPSFWATFLSRFVTKTSAGIGLGSPFTMQLAIQEVGLGKIFLGTLAALITRPFGIKGVFYHIAGREAASIDGPTEYSLYPSNVSAKLGPKEPEKVAEEIKKHIISLRTPQSNNFLGVVIIDANDIGRNVLGNSTGLSNKLIEEIFRDNPMGQGKEQTPIAIIVIV
ncbi:MAG: asparagine synthase (glutamine-hydrolyzing) [bacterium]|nr:asparagine synthase (glutamine-hydrolyzing) [bacterium]